MWLKSPRLSPLLASIAGHHRLIRNQKAVGDPGYVEQSLGPPEAAFVIGGLAVWSGDQPGCPPFYPPAGGPASLWIPFVVSDVSDQARASDP